MARSIQNIANNPNRLIYILFVAVSIFSLVGAVVSELYFLALIPFAILFAYTALSQYRYIYILFFFLLPFSIEVYLAGGFGTDLPSEPLMLFLCGLFVLLSIQRKFELKSNMLMHPISIVVALHLIWIYFVSIFSMDHIISFKYALAKTWYIIPFYFLSFLILDSNKEKQFNVIFKALWAGLSIAILYVMYRHMGMGFSFEDINPAVVPIFRNHVNYACMLVIFLPYLVYLFSRSKHKYLYLFQIVFLCVAIYLSYTRAAQLSIVIGALSFFMIRYRLTIYALLISGLVMVSIVISLVHKNNYLQYAPNYETTVAHKKFDNLIEATYKLEDISTMERVYRWVAGFTMISERPVLGYGPGCFYSFYKNHTVTSFKTYVSDNPEKSGIHNNYLMAFVEQGVVGFIIMLFLCFFPIIVGERAYHKLQQPWKKQLLMASIISVIICAAILLMNDLIEADKIGTLFFLSLSIIAILDLSNAKIENSPV